jgi:hypothetical protein
MIQEFPLNKKNIGSMRLFVRPQITEHFIPVAETWHPIFSCFSDVTVLTQNNMTQSQQTTFVGFLLANIETISVDHFFRPLAYGVLLRELT